MNYERIIELDEQIAALTDARLLLARPIEQAAHTLLSHYRRYTRAGQYPDLTSIDGDAAEFHISNGRDPGDDFHVSLSLARLDKWAGGTYNSRKSIR